MRMRQRPPQYVLKTLIFSDFYIHHPKPLGA